MILRARAHEILSTALVGPLHTLYRSVRPSLRATTRAYFEGRRFRASAHRWSLERRRAWMLPRLREAVRRAARDTAYYREQFARIGFDPQADFTFDDFARLPVLERADVHEAGERLISESMPRHLLKKDATGGSTGQPVVTWVGPEERGWSESAIEYYTWRLGLWRGARGASFWGHHLDPAASDGGVARLRAFAENFRWLEALRLSPSILMEHHAALERWQPRYILAYSTALAALAAELAERGIRPTYPSQCLITGAEKLTPAHRALIEAVFRRPVYERYGGRDVGAVAVQVDIERTFDFEVDWANLLVEPESAAPPASILVTKLHADGMPMLRYRLGDVARFPAPDSRPGHPTFHLHEIIGRELDRIWLPGGRWIQGEQFPHLLKDYPVREYQVVQGADARVVVRVVPAPAFRDESRAAILKIIGANLPGVPLSFEIVDHIPRTRANKLRFVVSELAGRPPASSPNGA